MRDVSPITMVGYAALALILASLLGDMPGPVGDGITQAAGWVRDLMAGLRAGLI